MKKKIIKGGEEFKNKLAESADTEKEEKMFSKITDTTLAKAISIYNIIKNSNNKPVKQ